MAAVGEAIDSFENVSERLVLPDSRNFTHLVSGGLVVRPTPSRSRIFFMNFLAALHCRSRETAPYCGVEPVELSGAC